MRSGKFTGIRSFVPCGSGRTAGRSALDVDDAHRVRRHTIVAPCHVAVGAMTDPEKQQASRHANFAVCPLRPTLKNSVAIGGIAEVAVARSIWRF
jgi:chaperonin GroEL (HSP60 family)